MPNGAADSLLRLPLFSRRNAVALTGKRPIVLLSPGQPLTMPVTAEYLASHGYLVVGMARKAARTFKSLEFTPNRDAIDAEAGDLAFALDFARGLKTTDAARVGIVGYSSSGLSNLAFAFQSRAPKAVAVFEGWEGWDVGQPLVRDLPGYDPVAFRAAYLLIEKTVAEPQPGFGKTSAHPRNCRACVPA